MSACFGRPGLVHPVVVPPTAADFADSPLALKAVTV